MQLNLIQQRRYLYAFSGSLVVLSLVALAVWGLNFGIDFKGGTRMEVRFSQSPPPDVQQVQAALADLSLKSLTTQPSQGSTMFLSYLASDDQANERVLAKLRSLDGGITELSTDFVGGTVSDQIKRNAIQGVILSIIGIAFYIAWAFRRVSGTVTSWDYGWGAVIALGHDILVTTGIFSVLGKFFGIEVGVPFIAALLTILGYSVNDTIVVYDRIRENLVRARVKEDFEITVNRSINETLGRSLNTSLTVIITLLAITLFGGESIRYFSLAILIGVTFGTYSSIWVASALLVTRYRMKTAK